MSELNGKGKAIAALAAIGVLGLMLYAYNDASLGTGAESEESMEGIANGIFDTHVIAFEALGILLTAVMIGAMIIAKPLGGRLDSENYPRTEDLTASQEVSDVDRNMGGQP